ncbi:MAG: cysteine--tRNA ligase [Candidatus Zixiibacteriota bacterium]
MPVRFFDTRQRALVDFDPVHAGEARLYTCGPTVYNLAHIGNFRTFLFEDILRRHLKNRGYKVTQVMNLTDIDDKIIKACRTQGVSLSDFTGPYKQAFFEDIDALRMERAEHYPEATTHVPEMVEMVKALLANEHAYKADDGSLYFRIASFPRYGELSHMDLSQLKAGARVSSDEYEKDAVSDFALWKAWDADDGAVFWETELGKGRPGWHLECSAMSIKYLGNPFDIHTGGVDNIFPHHENEIAQTIAATGKAFANYWLHAEHLIVEGRKMAKSLGNFFTLRDLTAKGYSPVAVRYLLISTHYRQQLNFTFDGLDAARAAIGRLRDFNRRLTEVANDGPGHGDFADLVNETREQFNAHLDNDLNVSGALGVLFDFVRDANRRLDANAADRTDAARALDLMAEFDRILGVLEEDKPAASDDAEIDQLIKERNDARASKNWARSDEIRVLLDQRGIILEDTPGGTRWKRRI